MMEYWVFQHSTTPILHHSGSSDFQAIPAELSALDQAEELDPGVVHRLN
jgi:hypothetical protein